MSRLQRGMCQLEKPPANEITEPQAIAVCKLELRGKAIVLQSLQSLQDERKKKELEQPFDILQDEEYQCRSTGLWKENKHLAVNCSFSADVISLCKLDFRDVGAHARYKIVCKSMPFLGAYDQSLK